MKIRLLGVLCVFSIAMANGAVALAAEDSYRIGVALGLSGPGRPYSQDALRGIQVAADEINAAGGMLGKHPIELIVENTRTNPEVAKKVVLKLVERDRVHAVIGTYSSASALAIKPILRGHRVIHLATLSNSEDITKLNFS